MYLAEAVGLIRQFSFASMIRYTATPAGESSYMGLVLELSRNIVPSGSAHYAESISATVPRFAR